MFIVVRRVIQIANMTIAIGSNISINHPNPDKPIIAINPTRALCAVEFISIKTGAAAAKPIEVAIVLIFATMICICFATKPSDAPTWFNISSSRRCNIAVFCAI